MPLTIKRIVSCLLGVFICVELVFLPLYNFLMLVPRQAPPLPEEMLTTFQAQGRASRFDAVQIPIDAAGNACERWSEGTGQVQGWSLFAPRFGAAGTFLTLKVTAADGTTSELRSRFEPADVDHFFRYDLVHYRQFYREQSYSIIYGRWYPGSFEKEGEAWREVIADVAKTFRRSLSAYVRWRLAEEWRPADAGKTAKEVIVAVRVFLAREPGTAGPRPEPVTLPLARWVADRPDQLAPYDPVTNRFAE
jgi:hypothetical protein